MTPTSSRGGWVVSGRGAEQQELIVHDAMTTVTSAIEAVQTINRRHGGWRGPGPGHRPGCIFVTWGVNKKYISSIT